jgi:hypothetical protein
VIPPAFLPIASPGAALRAYADHELGIAAAWLEAQGGRAHAGVHEARKSIRRARAAVALGRGALGAGARLVDRELRRLNRGLSALRDAHALVEVLERLAMRSHGEADRRMLRRARRAARVEAGKVRGRCAGDLAAAGETLAVLRAALRSLPWEAVTRPDCERALARARSRADAAGQRACKSDSDACWHRWRRRVRRLVHEGRACSMSGLAMPHDLRFEHCLAVQLGIAGELDLLRRCCGRDSCFSMPDRPLLRRFARKVLARQRRRIVSVVALRRGRGARRSDPLPH